MKSLNRPFRTTRLAGCLTMIGLAALLWSAPAAQPAAGSWSAGLQTRGFVDFEPGNDYVTGFDAGYSPDRVFGIGFGRRLELRAAYLTSRAEAAYRNVLKQDWFLFSPVWHFRRQRLFDPTLQLDFGWQRYDIENEAIFGDLENSAVIKGLQIGFQLNHKRYALRYAFGYQTASTASSVVYPLPFTLGFAVGFR
jgi:hypothetical protein